MFFLQKLYNIWDTFVLKCLHKEKNVFWKNVFNSCLNHIKTIYYHQNIKDNFFDIPVWHNSNLRVGNNFFFIKAWYENGIKVLQDFFYEDWNLWVFEFFKCTYNFRNICIMQCNSITTENLIFLRFLHVDRNLLKALPNSLYTYFFQCTRTFKNYLLIKEVYQLLKRNGIWN